MIQKEQLIAILNSIEGTDFKNVQSIDLLIDFGFKLQQWLAFSSYQQALCRETLHNRRRQAMVNLIASLKANNASLAPSLQKEYVNDLCAEDNGVYELACRCNSCCVHALDFLRSCISALKIEYENTKR